MSSSLVGRSKPSFYGASPREVRARVGHAGDGTVILDLLETSGRCTCANWPIKEAARIRDALTKEIEKAKHAKSKG